jgi:tripartite-type tricarboxylate transporter receptor subunit TctC
VANGGTAIRLTIAALLLVSPARADPVGDFYKGKQIRFLIGSGIGGGYDLFARLLARHMPRHIPGNPTIIVQH